MAKYLRLSAPLAAHGCQFDLASGFGISGHDVVEAPAEGTLADKYVRTQLRYGYFEEATRAEFKEVQGSDPDVDDEPDEPTLRDRVADSGARVNERVADRQQAQEDAENEHILDGDPNNVNDPDLAGDAGAVTRRERVKATQGTETKPKAKARK